MNPAKILVVEDEQIVALDIKRMLQRSGYAVLGPAATAEAAIHQVVKEQPDVVLMDIKLLGPMDGIAAAQEIRRRLDIPVIYLTALYDEETLQRAKLTEPYGYLLKPFNENELNSTLQMTLHRYRLEQQLKEHEQWLAATLNSIGEGVVTTDAQGRIKSMNPAAQELTGWTEVEAGGRPRAEVVQLIGQEPAAPESDLHLLQTGMTLTDHWLLARTGARILVDANFRSIRDQQGRSCGTVVTLRDITHRQQIEQAQAEKQEFYRSLFENNHAVMLLIDPGTAAIVDANAAACSFYGYRRVELTAKKITELSTLPEAQVKAAIAQAAAQKRSQFLSKHSLSNGQLRQVEIYSGPIKVGGRQLLCAIIHDITDRKQAEEELQRRNRELTLLNQVIAASVATTEPEKFLASVCRELAQAFNLSHAAALLVDAEQQTVKVVAGYAAQQVAPLPRNTFPFGPDSVVQSILTTRQPLAVADVQNEPRLANMQNLLGQLGLASLLLLPLTVETEVTAILALAAPEPHHFSVSQVNLGHTVADQVAGALTRVRLQQQHHQLSTVIEQTAESVVITDQTGAIIYVNPAFEQISGYSRAEAVGQNPRILQSGRHSIDFYEQLWQAITAGQTWQGRLINKKKDGSLYTEEATISPIRNDQGAIVNYVAVKRDVTRELELEEHYRQAQKLEAIGLLAGGIAHDFNNILTGINGFAELLYMQLPPGSPHQEDVAKILKGGQRAAELVRQLLAFSRKQVIEPKILDLNSLVSELERMLLRLIGEHIRLTTSLAPHLWPIKADPTQLEQIVLNLVINARDAMPNGGQLTIDTANVTLTDEDLPDQLELPPGEFVKLTVSDTGIGMSEQVKAHIFEPFFTTKELGRGTGLGLATVYGIVKQNCGLIWVDSEPGQGTTFQIYLPRVDEPVTPQPRPEWTFELTRGSETILLVEDEPNVRELAAEMLNRQGYRVLTAADGAEALKVADELAGPLDLLVTDVIMPRLNGPELAGRLKESRPDLKILYVSGYADEMIARFGILEHGVSLLPKPFSAMLLARKVRQVLEASANKPANETGVVHRLQPASVR